MAVRDKIAFKLGGLVMGPFQRIISLVPSATEIIYFLGLEASLVGVTEHCNYPGEAKLKEKVGTFGRPQTAKILSLKPDLVLADGALHKKVIEELKNSGVVVLSATPSCVEDVFLIMLELGRLCGSENSARRLANTLRERVTKLKQRSINRPRVFRLMSTDPLITPGPGSFQYDALEIAGAQMLTFGSKDPYVKVNLEQLKAFDPEIILFCGVKKGQGLPPKCKGCASKKPLCHRTVDDFITREWEQFTAVRSNRLFPISCHTICRPGPRLIDGMEKLQGLL